MATLCDCEVCPDGAPLPWEVILTGIANNICGVSANFNTRCTRPLTAVSGCGWSTTFAATCPSQHNTICLALPNAIWGSVRFLRM